MIGPMGSEADVAMNREGRSCLPKNSGFKIQDPSKEEIGRLYRDDLARWTRPAPRRVLFCMSAGRGRGTNTRRATREQGKEDRRVPPNTETEWAIDNNITDRRRQGSRTRRGSQ